MQNLTIDAVTDGRLSAYDLKALLDGSTYASLLAQFESTVVPLDEVAADMLGLPSHAARKLANQAKLPVPAFRLGGHRSPWLIHVRDLAGLIDAKHKLASQAMNQAAIDEAAA